MGGFCSRCLICVVLVVVSVCCVSFLSWCIVLGVVMLMFRFVLMG